MKKIHKILLFTVMLLLGSSIWVDQASHGNPKRMVNAMYKDRVYGVTTNHKVVALTFDDGPDPRFTPDILDTLKRYQAKATFFVLADGTVKHPELIKAIIAGGNELGDHTATHPHLLSLSQRNDQREIQAGYQAIKEVSGRPPLYFRPPYGETNSNIGKIVKQMGMRQILWEECIENQSLSPQDMAGRVLHLVMPGDIILLHDGRLDRSETVRALPLLMKGLQARGYRCVTISQLLEINKKNTLLRK